MKRKMNVLNEIIFLNLFLLPFNIGQMYRQMVMQPLL